MAKEKKVKKIHIADMEPLFMIAMYPRATIRFCLMFKPLIYFFFIGIVGSFSSELILFFQTTYQFQFSLGDIVSTSMFISVISYALLTLLMAALLQYVGKMLGGKGTFKQMFRAISLSYIPQIWILPIILFWMQLSPESYFIYGDFVLTIGDKIMYYVGSVIILIALSWSIFLSFKATQEVHRFKLLKTIISYLIVVITITVLLVALYSATGITII